MMLSLSSPRIYLLEFPSEAQRCSGKKAISFSQIHTKYPLSATAIKYVATLNLVSMRTNSRLVSMKTTVFDIIIKVISCKTRNSNPQQW